MDYGSGPLLADIPVNVDCQLLNMQQLQHHTCQLTGWLCCCVRPDFLSGYGLYDVTYNNWIVESPETIPVNSTEFVAAPCPVSYEIDKH